MPWALFWGVVTCVATIVPLLGTALVWLPLAAYLGLIGHWGAAVGLLAYGVVVITQVDNLARFVLQKRMADTHPLVTIFGVIIGLSLFGFMGVIFGPVLLSIFIFCADLFKRRYLDEGSDERSTCLACGTFVGIRQGMNFRQFYRCMCRNRSGIAPGAGCFAGCSRLRIRIAGWNYGRGNACVLFARYGEGGTEVVGPIFFGE